MRLLIDPTTVEGLLYKEKDPFIEEETSYVQFDAIDVLLPKPGETTVDIVYRWNGKDVLMQAELLVGDLTALGTVRAVLSLRGFTARINLEDITP